MADIILLDGRGEPTTYSGISVVEFDTVDGGRAQFIGGESVSKEVVADFSKGNQVISRDDGTILEKVTVRKPENLVPENIVEGATVGGVVGTAPTGELVDKTVSLDFSDGNQVVERVDGEIINHLTIEKPETLVPENIVEGVTVSGIVGAAASGGLPKVLGPLYIEKYDTRMFADLEGLCAVHLIGDEFATQTIRTAPTNGEVPVVMYNYPYRSRCADTTSGTKLSVSVAGCVVGDFVVAAVITRSDFTVSNGWTVISTSNVRASSQRISWVYKYAESDVETLTVTQVSSQRLYINLLALSGVTGFADNGYVYSTNTFVTPTKPTGRCLWCLGDVYWSANTGNFGNWNCDDVNLAGIYLGNGVQGRCGLFIDDSMESVTRQFTTRSTDSDITCGCLSIF